MNKFQESSNKLKEHGLTLVTKEKEFQGTNGINEIMCSKGHTWKGKICNILLPQRIIRPSKGCPECAAQTKDNGSKDKALSYLTEGHQILGNFNKTGATGTTLRFYSIQCPSGHIYEKKTRGISEGCPKCHEVTFVGQERVRLIFQAQFQKLFPSIRPEWLTNPSSGRKLELDGYCDELKIAFEYQGRQHFSNDTQFAGDHTLQSGRDNLKAQLCKEHGITLITINQPRHYHLDRFFESVSNDCTVQGFPLNITLEDCHFQTINDANTLIQKHSKFKSFVQSKGYKLHTSSLSSMQDVLDFECGEGHRFKMTGENFNITYSRPKYEKVACASCNEKINSHSIHSLISIETCKELAKQIGYSLNSTKYENINSSISWTCKHGHLVEKSFRQMTRNQTGQYCNTCKDLGLEDSTPLFKNKTTSKMSKSATGEIRDLVWLNDFSKTHNITNVEGKYLGMDIKHSFCCSKGHNFVSTISNLVEKSKKKTSMCPEYACGGKSIDLSECQDFAKENGLTCLSDKYENVNAPMQWQCDNGHSFTKTFRQFIRSKTTNYCPECSGNHSKMKI